MKLDTQGDTVYTKYFDPGTIYSITVDKENNLRLNIINESLNPFVNYLLIMIKMTPEGFILKRDTVKNQGGLFPYSCIIGKDSSLIIAGTMPRVSNPSQNSMFFLRVQKSGSVDPWVELNPGHPNCGANRVEQLPNGNYLVSGYVGSRIASYELDSLGLNPQFRQWYQTPDFTNMATGAVSRIKRNSFMLAGEGLPCIVGLYDSALNKKWLKKDIGTQIPPQAMIDSTIVFGYGKNTAPFNEIFRIGYDSSIVWYVNLRDSLTARGISGSLDLYAFAYEKDQSAVVAGKIYNGAFFQHDPFFIKISNIGTPVTSLSKPKKGSLQNQTLAPWPNPTGGTLYLKQHFDKAEIHFYNLAGKEISQYQIRFGQPIEISHLKGGVYLYRAVIDGKSYSGKVIKN